MYINTYQLVSTIFLSVGVETFLVFSLVSILIYITYEDSYYINLNFIKVNIGSHLIILTFLFSIYLLLANPFNQHISYSGSFILDEYSFFVKLVIASSSILSILLLNKFYKFNNFFIYEYLLLVGFSILGMFLIASSNDLISIYLSIELQSLCFYILASSDKNSEYSTEAGFKYFVLGAFSSGFLLLGFSLLYGLTGSINLESISKILLFNITNDYFFYMGVVISAILILSSLLFKLGVVPFHMWLPDVYEGSPTAITAFFAIVPKIAIVLLLVRFIVNVFYQINEIISMLLVIFSLLSMLIASLAALFQTRIKRLLAYSAISHIGYLLIGLCSVNITGLQVTFFYVLVYIIMSILIFTILVSIRDNKNNNEVRYINELTGLSMSNPLLAFSLAIVFFSMAGVPPLAGFFSKMYVFSFAINIHNYFLAILGIFTSVIAAVYYIYIIRVMYFNKINVFSSLVQIDSTLSIIISIFMLIIVMFFIDCSWLLEFANELAIYFVS